MRKLMFWPPIVRPALLSGLDACVGGEIKEHQFQGRSVETQASHAEF